MTIINHRDGGGDREPLRFVHMVPFRNFDDWVESAIKQLYVSDECNMTARLLDRCYGYRELYVELYPKMVLSLLVGMTFDSHKARKGKDESHKAGKGKDKHHIMLYNYVEADRVIAEVSAFFGVEPLRHTGNRYKTQRDEGTCQREISRKFHACYDDTLAKTDAVRALKAEAKRRKREMIRMKQLYHEIKRAEGALPLAQNITKKRRECPKGSKRFCADGVPPNAGRSAFGLGSEG